MIVDAEPEGLPDRIALEISPGKGTADDDDRWGSRRVVAGLHPGANLETIRREQLAALRAAMAL